MADIKVKITVSKPSIKKFKVGGKTLTEALKVLNSREEWGVYDATQNPKSSARQEKDGSISAVTMTLSPVIELPEWSGYSSATKEQKKAWDDMVDALKAHEFRHHDIQVASAADLEKKLKKLTAPTASDVNDLIKDQQESCQKAQDAYDARSKHGAKEGVVLDEDA